MNIYQKVYLQDLILEENIKSLIPNIQSQLLTDIGVSNYQSLTQHDKILFQEKLNNILEHIKEKVSQLTNNLQYQSWVYKILKQKNKDIDEDYNVLKTALIDFTKLCKRPDLLPQQKNIQNYQTFQDLQKFILSFQKEHKLENNIYNNLKKLYNNQKYTCYLITNYQQCNKLFGGQKYFNTGWCIAKSKYHFNNYLNEYPDKFNGYIVFIENTTNKPYALLHYGSKQFKDTSDQTLTNNDKLIIDCLYNINSNIKNYSIADTDLYNYLFDIYSYKNPGKLYLDLLSQVQFINYDKINKTIDLKGNTLRINEKLLNENIFSYNIVNCIRISFQRYKNLIKLPDNFYIPNSVKDYSAIFYGCTNLTKLPDNFAIPNSVKNCNDMFYGCTSLTKLPDNFTIPNSVKDCRSYVLAVVLC